MDARQRGQLAEDQAWELLRAQGAQLLARNFRTRLGEIDLIVQAGDSIIFVEVRYRGQDRFGSASESVTARKQARVIAAAQYFLQRHPQAANRPCRFDVITVNGPDGATEWIKNAFQTG